MNKALFLFLVLIIPKVYALSTGQVRAGAGLGTVQLDQNVGQRHGTGPYFTAFFDYVTTDKSLFELSYLKSQHNTLDHTAINFGFHYFFLDPKPLEVMAMGGLSLLTNTFTIDSIGYSTSGTGVFLGLGLNYPITSNILLGATYIFTKGFEQSVQLPNGDRVKSLQDDSSIGARVTYLFGGGGGD